MRVLERATGSRAFRSVLLLLDRAASAIPIHLSATGATAYRHALKRAVGPGSLLALRTLSRLQWQTSNGSTAAPSDLIPEVC